MLQVFPWPNVILHLDGDAFFASVIQAVNPSLRGKPIAVGKERGIATAFSYEAKRYGVRRGMRELEIKRICPDCLFLDSDYETYNLFSRRMFDIIKSFTPWVEEYSIDEAFADIKGLRRPLNMSYFEIGKKIKEKIENNLGITVSVGISLNKSLAKLASSSSKPSGLRIVDGPSIEKLLEKTPLINIWGIGTNTSAYLQKLGIKNALEFALKSENFIRSHLSKPFLEIWRELRGEKIYELNLTKKTTYQSITRSQTFKPPIANADSLWSRLIVHIEDAFQKARQLHYQVGRLTIFLKTQGFYYHVKEIKLLEKTVYPFLIKKQLRHAFEEIYQKGALYRTTGCTIYDLAETINTQPTLFNNDLLEKKIAKIYPLYETKKIDFGSKLFDKAQDKKEGIKPKLRLPFLSLSPTT